MTYTPKFPRRSRRPLGAPGEVAQNDLDRPLEEPDDVGFVTMAEAVAKAMEEIRIAYLEHTPASEMARA